MMGRPMRSTDETMNDWSVALPELGIDFAFEFLHTHRLEARAAVCNARGNGALRKLGAEREGLLRHAFFRDGDYLDQVLWSILAEDWRRRQQDTLAWRSSVVH